MLTSTVLPVPPTILKKEELDKFFEIVNSQHPFPILTKFRGGLLKYIRHVILDISNTPQKTMVGRRAIQLKYWQELMATKIFEGHLADPLLESIRKDLQNHCKEIKVLYPKEELNKLLSDLDMEIENIPYQASSHLVPERLVSGVKKSFNLNIVLPDIREVGEGVELYTAGEWRDALDRFNAGIAKIGEIASGHVYYETLRCLQRYVAYTHYALSLQFIEQKAFEQAYHHVTAALTQIQDMNQAGVDADGDVDFDAHTNSEDLQTASTYLHSWKKVFFKYCDELEAEKEFSKLINFLITAKNNSKPSILPAYRLEIQKHLSECYAFYACALLDRGEFIETINNIKLAIAEHEQINSNLTDAESMQNYYVYHKLLTKSYYDQAKVLVESQQYKDAIIYFSLVQSAYKKINPACWLQGEKQTFDQAYFNQYEKCILAHARSLATIEEVNHFFQVEFPTQVEDTINWLLNKTSILIHLEKAFHYFKEKDYINCVACLNNLPNNLPADLNQQLLESGKDFQRFIFLPNIPFNDILIQLAFFQQTLIFYNSDAITSDAEFMRLLEQFAGYIMLQQATQFKNSPSTINIKIKMFEKIKSIYTEVPGTPPSGFEDQIFKVSCQNIVYNENWIKNTLNQLIIDLNVKVAHKATFAYSGGGKAGEQYRKYAVKLKEISQQFSNLVNENTVEKIQAAKDAANTLILGNSQIPHLALLTNIHFLLIEIEKIKIKYQPAPGAINSSLPVVSVFPLMSGPPPTASKRPRQ